MVCARLVMLVDLGASVCGCNENVRPWVPSCKEGRYEGKQTPRSPQLNEEIK